METNNETVEQVYAEAMETTGVFPSRQTYAKRYLAAHKRELADRDGERKGILKANEALAAEKSRLREEIARLKACISGDCERRSLGAEPCADCFREHARQEIEKRDGIIKELADIVSELKDSCACKKRRGFCNNCSDSCLYRKCVALVAKARETAK